MLDGNFYSCLPGLFIFVFVSLTNNQSNSTRTWITVSMLYDWMCIYLLTPSKSYFQVSSIWMWKTGPMRLKIWNMCHWYGFLYALLPYGLLSTEVPFIYFNSYCIVVGPFLTSRFPYRSNSWRGVPCVSVVQSFPFFTFSLSKELFNSIPSMDKSCRCKSKFYSLFLFIRLFLILGP